MHWFRFDPPKVKIRQKKSWKQTVFRLPRHSRVDQRDQWSLTILQHFYGMMDYECTYNVSKNSWFQRKLHNPQHYGNTGSRSRGYKIGKIFSLKLNTAKGNYWILRIGVMGSRGIKNSSLCYKINWCYQKMLITKNVPLNWYSSMKKDFNNFWHRKLTLKVEFRHFLTLSYYNNS